MIRRFVLGVGLVVTLLLCLSAAPPVLREMIWRLPIGWYAFLRRTLPEVTFNWHGVGMTALCSTIIVVAMHSFCGWLYRAMREGGHASQGPERWQRRWTAALFAAFWLLFAVVMGAAGLGRQVQRVFQSDQPLYIQRGSSGWAELKQADGALATALVENPTNVAQAQAVFMKGDYERVGTSPTLWESHHLLLFTNRQGQFVGDILFSRNPRDRDRIGFIASGDGIHRDFQPMANLPNVIAHLEKLAK